MVGKIVRRAILTTNNLSTGYTKHFLVTDINESSAPGAMPFIRTPMPAPSALIIVQFDGPEVNLVHLNEMGAEMTDTYHNSIAEAETQAEREFGIKPSQWSVVEEAY